MADVKNSAEPTFPTKRIPDSTTQDSTNEPKKQKLDNPENNLDNNGIQPQQNDDVQKEKQQVEEEELEEPSSGKAVIDRKGKGILIEEDDEEDEDVDEDDSDDDSDSDSDDSVIGDDEEDSDFADDPLAEVDLDNILPSRTRRKVIHPGVYLRNDIPQDDDSDDDIDDPDA